MMNSWVLIPGYKFLGKTHCRAVVYIWGFWVSYFTRFSLIFPHFFLKLKSRTTFSNFLNILKTTQIYHTTPSSSHDISLTNSYKSFQLNSISLKHIHHQYAQSKQLTIYHNFFLLISIFLYPYF